MAYKSVVVPYDFSPQADSAFEEAVELARCLGIEKLRVVFVYEELAADIRAKLEDLGQEEIAGAILEQVQKDFERHIAEHPVSIEGFKAELDVRTGQPSGEVLLSAAEAEADIVVCGASGKGMLERFLLGSTAQRLVRQALADVLVVKPRENAGFRRIAVGVDMSACSRHALETALQLAASCEEGELHVVHAYALPSLANLSALSDVQSFTTELAQEAEGELATWLESVDMGNVTTFAHVLEGRATSALEDFVVAKDCDLLVLGSVGRTGLARVLIGNTAERILRRVPCSMLVVKPQPESAIL